MIKPNEHAAQPKPNEHPVRATFNNLRTILADGVARHRAEEHEEYSDNPHRLLFEWSFAGINRLFLWFLRRLWFVEQAVPIQVAAQIGEIDGNCPQVEFQ